MKYEQNCIFELSIRLVKCAMSFGKGALYPMLKQSLQAGFLMGAGDVVCQTLVEKQPLTQIDYKRTLRFCAVGTFVVGPTLSVWYRILARWFGTHGNMAAGFKKTAIDQLCFAPVGTGFFLTAISLSQGASVKETKQFLKNKYGEVLYNNYKVWPWVQIVNFSLVPLRYQVLVVQTVAVFWNAYLSHATEKKH